MSDMSAFERAVSFTLKWEGGFSDDPADPGNWTGGAINSGELRGTKYGISSASYPWIADRIKDLTVDEAKEIYRRDYWEKLGLGDDVALEVAFAVFDAAVNHGTGRVVAWWSESGRNVDAFMLRRLEFYANLGGFNTYGRGWVRRWSDLQRVIQELRDKPVKPVHAKRFFLILFGATVQLPMRAASVVGDKLYVRLGAGKA